MSRAAAVPTPASPQGEFARLLETERRLDERLRQARAEAEALVAAAQAEAARRETALAAELEGDALRLDAELAAEQRRREQEVADAARAEGEAYDGVAPARVTAIALGLAPRLIGGAGGFS